MEKEGLTQTQAVEGNKEAFEKIKKTLQEQGNKIIYQRLENKNRDLFLVVSKNGKEERLYCKYRKEYFLSYAFQFLGEKGFGESINREVLLRAFRLKTDRIIFAYWNREIRWCYPMQIKNYAESNDTIRTQNGKEITYSFPISLLNKL